MNDLELNKALAEKLGLQNIKPYYTLMESSILDINGKAVDYCNNWADTGPLIEKYKIELEYDISNDSWGAFHCVEVDADYQFAKSHCWADTPLRAVCLCLLEVLE